MGNTRGGTPGTRTAPSQYSEVECRGGIPVLPSRPPPMLNLRKTDYRTIVSSPCSPQLDTPPPDQEPIYESAVEYDYPRVNNNGDVMEEGGDRSGYDKLEVVVDENVLLESYPVMESPMSEI
eukprot:sb/3475985/